MRACLHKHGGDFDPSWISHWWMGRKPGEDRAHEDFNKLLRPGQLKTFIESHSDEFTWYPIRYNKGMRITWARGAAAGAPAAPPPPPEEGDALPLASPEPPPQPPEDDAPAAVGTAPTPPSPSSGGLAGAAAAPGAAAGLLAALGDGRRLRQPRNEQTQGHLEGGVDTPPDSPTPLRGPAAPRPAGSSLFGFYLDNNNPRTGPTRSSAATRGDPSPDRRPAEGEEAAAGLSDRDSSFQSPGAVGTAPPPPPPEEGDALPLACPEPPPSGHYWDEVDELD